MSYYCICFSGTLTDRSAVLSRCDRHDVGTWGLCAADFASRLAASVAAVYWQGLLSIFPICSTHMQLMCSSTIIGWFEIAALVGAVCLVLAGAGVKRRYGLVILGLLALLHVLRSR